MDDKFLTPPLKTQGIKKKLTPWIREKIASFPRDSRFVEPFMGSGSVSLNMPFTRYLLMDANPHLIAFYTALRGDAGLVRRAQAKMEEMYDRFQDEGGDAYYAVRDLFNKNHDPVDFLVVNRACFNGLMRFNRKGEFNSPFCRNLKRFNKAHRTKVVNQLKRFREFLVENDVSLICADFRKVTDFIEEGDILYADPPYMGRNTCYYNEWSEEDENDLHAILSSANFHFLLSTWHSDRKRINPCIEKYRNFQIMTRDHYYFIGPKEENRFSVSEALITNF